MANTFVPGMQSPTEELVAKWQKKLGLKDWLVNVHLQNDFCPGREDIEAEIETDRPYMQAELHIFRPYADLDHDRRERVIVHELVHLMTGELDELLPRSADDALEHVVQVIAMAFYHALK